MPLYVIAPLPFRHLSISCLFFLVAMLNHQIVRLFDGHQGFHTR